MAQIFSEAGKVVIADVRQIIWIMPWRTKSKNADVHPIHLDVTDRKAFYAAADEVEHVYGTPPQPSAVAGVNFAGEA